MSDAEGDVQPAKKVKRPWRHKVRREATKKRKQAEREALGLPDNNQSVGKKRQAKLENKISSKKDASVASTASNSKTKKEAPADKLVASRFRYLNEQLYTQPAREAQEVFRDDNDAFKAYHNGYQKQLEKWPLNPLDFLIKDLSTLGGGCVVADMGCGEARIAQELGDNLTVHSFDLVALNKHVTACNITKTPLEDASVDVVVYCLSLMGTNLGDFLREANRILKIVGKLKIAEVTSRFRNVKTFIHAVEQMGFDLKRKKELTGYFIVMTFTKSGKVKQKRPTGLILEPCLYKKR